MNNWIESYVDKADRIKMLMRQKDLFADAMKQHKTGFNDAQKGFERCEEELAKICQDIVSKN